MVHTFGCIGRNFMLDVESGSLYEIDELTRLAVEKRIAPEKISAGAFSRYSGEELAAVESEIDELVKEGVLLLPRTSTASLFIRAS